MTLRENVMFPLQEYSDLSPAMMNEIAAVKLQMVGLGHAVDRYPSQVSGGMKKRAALARALATEPSIVFLDEPSSGLDPVSSKQLDELVTRLRDALGTTFVMVSHELASIFAIATSGAFLDASTKSMTFVKSPQSAVYETKNSALKAFLTRGAEELVL